MNRPSLDSYFMSLSNVAATRSTCIRRVVGAVIARDNQVISTGYNGSPSGTAHCVDIGCIRLRENIPSGTQHEKCRAVHAEQNAIIQAAVHGVSVSGGTLYCTHQPCILCAKIIINAGIKRVVFGNDYPDIESTLLLIEAGVELVRMEKDGELICVKSPKC